MIEKKIEQKRRQKKWTSNRRKSTNENFLRRQYHSSDASVDGFLPICSFSEPAGRCGSASAYVSMKYAGPYSLEMIRVWTKYRGALHPFMSEMRRTDADPLFLGITTERPQQPLGHLHHMWLPATPHRRGLFRTSRFADHVSAWSIPESGAGRCAIVRKGNREIKPNWQSWIHININYDYQYPPRNS